MRQILTGLLLAAYVAVPALAEPGYNWITSYQPPETYGTLADEIDLADARLLFLQLVNNERELAGVAPLALQDEASRASQQHASEMAEFRYLNHYSLAGLKCERRYNELGQTDHVVENIAMLEVGSAVYLTPQVVGRILAVWLDSEAHRKTILDGLSTHLGCGIELRSSEGSTYIAAAALLVRQYGSYSRLPLSATVGEELEIGGSFDQPDTGLAYIGVGREPLPELRSPQYQLEHMGPYKQPEPLLQLLPPDGMGRWDLPTNPIRVYSAECSLAVNRFYATLQLDEDSEPGMYYITAWATDGEAEPFCVMTQVVEVQNPSV